MAAVLIEPNLHVALVHFPIALIVMGVLLEVFCFLWHRSSARTAGRWMIVLGVFAAVPALTTGLYAFRETVAPGTMDVDRWVDVVNQSPWTDPGHWATMQQHITSIAIGTGLLLVSMMIWIASSDVARKYLHWLGMVFVVIGASLIGYGAHEGGQLVYHYGTGVRVVEKTATDGPGAETVPVLHELSKVASPYEIHLLLAGIVIALVAAAIALSIRRSNAAWENRQAEDKAVAAGYRPAGQFGQASNPLAISLIYPGWFWVLAVVFAIASAATGMWIFGIWHPMQLLQQVNHSRLNDDPRGFIHAYGAILIIGLSLLLGIVTRFAPRRRVILSILCMLLVFTVAAQIWIGILLLFDGDSGPAHRFKQSAANQPTSIVPVPKLLPSSRLVEKPLPLPATSNTRELELPANSPAGNSMDDQ